MIIHVTRRYCSLAGLQLGEFLERYAVAFGGTYGYFCENKPDLQNILRQSYDYLTIMPKLRSTYDGRLTYKTSYDEWKAFHR